MKTKFEIVRLVNGDVIATSTYVGCMKLLNNNNDHRDVLFFYDGIVHDDGSFLTETYYVEYKNANGGQDLALNTWYAVYMDENDKITSIKEHDQIGHSDHKAN